MKNNHCFSMGIDIKFSNINRIITTGIISITLDRALPNKTLLDYTISTALNTCHFTPIAFQWVVDWDWWGA